MGFKTAKSIFQSRPNVGLKDGPLMAALDLTNMVHDGGGGVSEESKTKQKMVGKNRRIRSKRASF